MIGTVGGIRLHAGNIQRPDQLSGVSGRFRFRRGFRLRGNNGIRFLIITHSRVQRRHGDILVSVIELGGILHVPAVADLNQLELGNNGFPDPIHVPGACQLFSAHVPGTGGIHPQAVVPEAVLQVFPVHIVEVVHRVFQFFVRGAARNDHVRNVALAQGIDDQAGVLLIDSRGVGGNLQGKGCLPADKIREGFRRRGPRRRRGPAEEPQRQNNSQQFFHVLFASFDHEL